MKFTVLAKIVNILSSIESRQIGKAKKLGIIIGHSKEPLRVVSGYYQELISALGRLWAPGIIMAKITHYFYENIRNGLFDTYSITFRNARITYQHVWPSFPYFSKFRSIK